MSLVYEGLKMRMSVWNAPAVPPMLRKTSSAVANRGVASATSATQTAKRRRMQILLRSNSEDYARDNLEKSSGLGRWDVGMLGGGTSQHPYVLTSQLVRKAPAPDTSRTPRAGRR